ncbi:MAG TPA: hypothetical protein DCQ98_01220 [Planctomycetaceae bacterium]|nr:hypothetical protein [Planctomycetaceae bacterium]
MAGSPLDEGVRIANRRGGAGGEPRKVARANRTPRSSASTRGMRAKGAPAETSETGRVSRNRRGGSTRHFEGVIPPEETGFVGGAMVGE